MPDNDSSKTYPQGPSHDDWLIDAANWWRQALRTGGAEWRARLDKEARDWLRDARPRDELTPFDLDFMREVCPRLTGHIRFGATMVGQGLESFALAHRRVMQVALDLGAAHLSDAATWDLDDWIDHAILAWIDEPPPKDLITPDRLAEITGEPRGEKPGGATGGGA